MWHSKDFRVLGPDKFKFSPTIFLKSIVCKTQGMVLITGVAKGRELGITTAFTSLCTRGD